MFGVKIQGRLGNQLFQYVYARVLSEKFNTPYFLLGFKSFYAHKYFEIEVDSPLKMYLKAVKFYLQNVFSYKEIVEDQYIEPGINISKEQDNAIYNGFYQSEQYHSPEIADRIRNEMVVKEQYRVNIRDWVKNDKPVIVVHVRRTDYVSWGGELFGGYDMSLPITYYEKALNELAVNDCNVLFLSDDIKWVKENFTMSNAIFSEGNSEITDFQLLMQADYLVLANSSFSWWGAYLNPTVKKVIAPKYWIGTKIEKEHPVGICRKEWTLV